MIFILDSNTSGENWEKTNPYYNGLVYIKGDNNDKRS